MVQLAVALSGYSTGRIWKSFPNPCPCGFLTDPRRACSCAPVQVQRYRAKISGPLLDRIDVQIDVPAVPFQHLSDERPHESSSAIRARVVKARALQRARYAADNVGCNAELTPRLIRKYCGVDADSRRLLELAMQRFGLSARAYARVLKVARTIADLGGRERIEPPDVAEAIACRSFDRRLERTA
ncbi:MAG: ATP-binding protein [Nitrospirota bacterium]